MGPDSQKHLVYSEAELDSMEPWLAWKFSLAAQRRDMGLFCGQGSKRPLSQTDPFDTNGESQKDSAPTTRANPTPPMPRKEARSHSHKKAKHTDPEQQDSFFMTRCVGKA